VIERVEVVAHLAGYLDDYCNLEPGTVTADSRLREDLGLDSFDLVALLIEVEETYARVVTDAEAAELDSVADVAELVASRTSR
jgi:acyl carrier protein